MINITPEEARVHAHICLDGCMHTSVTRRCRSELLERPNRSIRIRYDIVYWNYSRKLREEFQNDVKKAYRRKCVVIDDKRVKVDGKWIFERLRFLGAGKSREWKIPDLILNGKDGIKREWLRVAIDDEGTITKYGAIRIRSVNRVGMEQLKDITNSINIKSHITPKNGKYNDGSVYLAINKEDVPLLLSKVGYPKHEAKKAKLKKIFKVQ